MPVHGTGFGEAPSQCAAGLSSKAVTPLLAPVRQLVSGVVPSALRRLDRQVTERLAKATVERNGFGYDPYGFHPAAARSVSESP